MRDDDVLYKLSINSTDVQLLEGRERYDAYKINMILVVDSRIHFLSRIKYCLRYTNINYW